MKGLVLAILLSLLVISTNNPVEAQCPSPRTADDACKPTTTEYKECESAGDMCTRLLEICSSR